MNNSEEDQIDLGRLLVKLIRIVSKNRLVLILLPLIGLACAFVYVKNKTPVYESSMMLKSDILTEAYSHALMDNLKILLEEGNKEVIAQKLNIKLEEASHLKSIDVISINDSKTEDAEKNLIFVISVEITDKKILKNLQNGVSQYLENNEYVKKRVRLRKERFSNLVEKVRRDIMEIDSLKGDFFSGKAYEKSSGGNVVFFDPTSVYSTTMKLYQDEISYMQSLELVNSISLIEGFAEFKKPIKPRPVFSLALGLVLGFVLALLIAIFREVKDYVKELESQPV